MIVIEGWPRGEGGTSDLFRIDLSGGDVNVETIYDLDGYPEEWNVNASGDVADDDRTAFLAGHVAAAHRALESGVPLRGFFVWSLFDNFEWGMGLSKRFGIVHVDFDTLKRTIKASGRWYAGVTARHGLVPDDLPAAPATSG